MLSADTNRERETTDGGAVHRWARLAQAVNEAAVIRSLDPNHPLVQLGRFELLCMLGEGGYGIVFKARDPVLDRDVALKLCLARDKRTTMKLTREAQVLAKLKHPNIVAVYDLGQHGQDVFIAMEYVAGSTVSRFARTDPSLEAIVRVYCDVGRGLAAAHERGIVHRDVKPSNILIDRGGVPRVVDFGLARLLGSASVSPRKRYTPSGTPAYMAPEVLRGQEPDALSDQWSFGVSLWETLTKEPLFDGRRPGQVRRQIRRQLAAKLAHERVHADVREILRRALAIEPCERYPSMQALVADLERLLPARASESTPGELIELRPSAREVPPTKRRRGVFAVALVLVGTLLGWALRSESPRPSVDLGTSDSTPADSPCMGVSRGEELDADRVMRTACEMIRDGDLDDAHDFWKREYKARLAEKDATAQLAPEKGDKLALELAATTLRVARTFLDQAELLSRDRTKAVAAVSLRHALLIVVGPVDRNAARHFFREVESHVIYADMKTAAENAARWAIEAKVAQPLVPESEEIVRRAGEIDRLGGG